MVLCSILKNTVTVHEDIQGAIATVVTLQMRPHTKHITIKYHQFRSFVANGDVEIQLIDTKEQITNIFTKLLYSELFGYLLYKLNGR